MFGPPGQDCERRWVWLGQHVSFLDAGITIDRGPVEGHSLLERNLKFRRADSDRLEKALNVGEPQTNETDAPLFNGTEDVVSLFAHGPKF